jgi:hypothetical protein
VPAALEERVRMLDSLVAGVWPAGEPGGRYARVSRRFERWLDAVEEVRRRRGRADTHDELVFVADIEAAWKEDCALLRRRALEWQRVLDDLGHVPSVDDGLRSLSGLEAILRGCRSLVEDMLAELALMDQIERDALREENAWIKNMTLHDDAAKPAAGAIWRVI